MTDSIANRKGRVIALCVIAALILGVAAALWATCHVAEQRYGLSPAPEISHEQYADNECRVRLVVRPELLLPYLEHYLPEEGEAPMIGPSTSELFRRLLPREIALLARSDLPSDKIYLTLFVNEQYGGPYIQTQINNANVLASVPGVQWTSKGLELRERGALIAEGALALSETSKEVRLEYWPQHSQNSPDTIEGDHFVELMVDNTNGDILALFAVAASALRIEIEELISSIFPIYNILGPYIFDKEVYYNAEVVVENLLYNIKGVNLSFYRNSADTVFISLVLSSVYRETGFDSVLSSLYLPHWKRWLNDNVGLVIDGSMHWDDTDEVIVGTYTLSGIEPILRDILSATTTLFEDRGPLFDMLYSVNTALQQ